MAPNVKLQSLDAVVTYDEPEFQRAESSAQWHVPIAIFEYDIRSRRLVSQVLRKDIEGSRQRPAIGHKETTAIEIREHPFVRIKAVAVRQLQAALYLTKFRTQRRGSGHSRVHVQPQFVLLANPSDCLQRIKRQRRSGSDRGAYEERELAGAFVFLDRFLEQFRPHGEVRVHVNQVQVAPADSGYFHILLD